MNGATGTELPTIGTIKWFNRKKHYGFIHTVHGDVFFRHSGHCPRFRVGAKVTFRKYVTRKGWRARELKTV